jgi:geranylgeranyl reductase family protein
MYVSTIRDYYDIIIIGAGPAGLNAGMHLIKSGAKVLLIDKTTPWLKPIACAEGVGRLGFEESVEIRQSWIRHTILSATFHSPNDTQITYRDKNGGYIINRAQMQHDLADTIATNGIDCAMNFEVKTISTKLNDRRIITFKNGAVCSARVIIDASGPIGGFGKGEIVVQKPADLEPAYFAVVENITIDMNSIHIYSSASIAPGGYAWVFPRDKNTANIGIVIGRNSACKNATIKTLLNEFLKNKFPETNIIHRFAGSIPCHFKKGPMATQGLIKAGDAASTVNPISRAGISEALLCGGLAGDYAIKMLNCIKPSEYKKVCNEYEKNWNKQRGIRHTKLARVKTSMISVPDKDYNEAANILSQIPKNELTMSKIFKASLGRFPRLVWAMRHLM